MYRAANVTQRVLLFAQQKEKFGSKVASAHSIDRTHQCVVHTQGMYGERKREAPLFVYCLTRAGTVVMGCPTSTLMVRPATTELKRG